MYEYITKCRFPVTWMMSARLSVSLLIWLYLNYLWLRYSWNCINSFEIIKMFKWLFRKGRQLIWRLLLTSMMNCFCRKAFSHITSQRSVDRGSHHCKPPDTPRTGFKLSQKPEFRFRSWKLCSSDNHNSAVFRISDWKVTVIRGTKVRDMKIARRYNF